MGQGGPPTTGTKRTGRIAGLRRYFGDKLDFDVPGGGFFVWARLPSTTNAEDLLTSALAHRVSYMPGTDFYAVDPDHATLRLSFSGVGPDDLTEAAYRLYQAWAEGQDGVPR